MRENDVSARDLQRQTSQWLAGKAIDTFAPMGPGIVPVSEIPDPQRLTIVTRLNGEVVQYESTASMLFTVAEAISFITLEPGDIIATGTPSGVGSAQSPPRFLRHGDVVEVEIESVETICNPVVGPEAPVTSTVAEAVPADIRTHAETLASDAGE